jgi:hypothetical protein
LLNTCGAKWPLLEQSSKIKELPSGSFFIANFWKLWLKNACFAPQVFDVL